MTTITSTRRRNSARRRSYAHALMERALSDAIRHTRRQEPEEAADRRAGLTALRQELRDNMPTEIAAALDMLTEQHAFLAMDLQHVHLYGGEPELEGRLAGLSAVIDELEFAALYE